jgi:hypothetical protein
VGNSKVHEPLTYKAPDSRNDVVFLDSTDSAIRGLHMNGPRKGEPAIVLRRCRRFHLSDNVVLGAGAEALATEEVEELQISGGNLKAPR